MTAERSPGEAASEAPSRAPGFVPVSSYPLARTLVTDDEGFAPPHMAEHLDALQRESGRDLTTLIRVARNALFFMSGPRHAAARVAVLNVLGRNRLAVWQPVVAAAVDGALDRIGAAEAPDLMWDFATPVYREVSRHVMGVHPGDPEVFDRWAGQLQEVLEPLLPLRRVMELQEGFRALLEQVRHQDHAPAPGSVLAALRAHPPGDFEDEDIVSLVVVLYGASINLAQTLANIVRSILQAPEAEKKGAGDPRWVARRLETWIRLNASPRYIYRIARRHDVIDGCPFTAGDNVVVDLHAIHRDPQAYPDPHAPASGTPAQTREHLAFGRGLHRCVGASLTRLVLSVAVPALFRRYPDIRLAEERIRYADNSQALALAALPVRLVPPSPIDSIGSSEVTSS